MGRRLLVALTLSLLAGCGGAAPAPAAPTAAPAALAPAVPEPAPAAPQPLWLTAVHFVDAEQGWVAGIERGCGGGKSPAPPCRGAIFRTSDGGHTWARQYAGAVAPLALHFLNARHGWAAGGPAGGDIGVRRDWKGTGTLLQTDDGGATWAPLYSAGGGVFLSVQFLTPEQGWLTTNGPGLLRTGDGGKSWSPVAVSCGDWVSFAGPRTGYLFCGLPRNPGPGMAGKALLRSTDGGGHWAVVDQVSDTANRRRDGLPLTGYGSGVHFRTVDEGWIALERGGLLHTADAGRTWHSLIAENFPGATPLRDGVDYSEATAVQFLTADRGFAVLGQEHLMTTADGGRTWHQIFPAAAP